MSKPEITAKYDDLIRLSENSPEWKRLNAYYYSFEPTGVAEIDEILQMVAMAGRHYHNTNEWTDPDLEGGISVVDMIQEAAIRAASKISSAS